LRVGWLIFETSLRRGEGNVHFHMGLMISAWNDRARSPVDRVLSACKVLGTRKVVNYTVLRRSHGKLWWKSVAVLTCKLCSLSAA